MTNPQTGYRSMKRRTWRLLLLLAIGALLIAGVLLYCELYLAHPFGSGPAGPPVPGEPFHRTWTDRKVLVLGAGDSITAGFGVPQSHSLVGRLADNPADEFPDVQGKCLRRVLPNLSVLNIAVSGSTSVDHLEIIGQKLEAQPDDVLGLVVLTTGGNDLIHDYGRSPPKEGAMYGATLEEAQPWIESFEKRLGDILDLIASRFPGGCQVFLADIYDPTDGVGDADTAGLPGWPDGLAVLGAYNDVIHRVAARRDNVHLVAIHATFLGHGIHCTQFWREHYRADDPHYWYATHLLEDGNARGHDAIRRLFLREMAKVSVRLPGRPVAKTR